MLLTFIPFWARILALLALVGAVWGHGVYFEHGRMQGKVDAVQGRFDTFKAQVQANGEAAQKAKVAQESADKAKKEKADRENLTTLAAVRADNLRLRNERAASGFLPSPAAGSPSPPTATFDRPLLERALQRFDAGVSGIVEAGDEARVNLDTAKGWAQHPD